MEGCVLKDAAILVDEIRQLDDAERTAFYYKAVRLKALRHMLTGEMYQSVRKDLGFSESVASKMLTVADNIGEDIVIPDSIHATYLYHIARAVRDGHGTPDELLAEAVNQPMSDFVEKYELVAPRKVRPLCVCPICKCEHPREEA
jgi:hypothetical protein